MATIDMKTDSELRSMLTALKTERKSILTCVNNPAHFDARVENARKRVTSLTAALEQAQAELDHLTELGDHWEYHVDQLNARIKVVHRDLVIAENQAKLKRLMRLQQELNDATTNHEDA